MLRHKFNASRYNDGVVSVLTGDMQKREVLKKHFHILGSQSETVIHPNYLWSRRALNEGPKETAEIIRGAFVLRAMKDRGSWLNAADLVELGNLNDEVDGLVSINGEPIRFGSLNFLKTIGNLSTSGLVTIIEQNANINMSDKARAVIHTFPDQSFTVFPETALIHPSTSSMAHHVVDTYMHHRASDSNVA